MICPNIRKCLDLLAKIDKTVEEYEYLSLKDSELSFKAIELGQLKYIGQVRIIPQYNRNMLDMA